MVFDGNGVGHYVPEGTPGAIPVRYGEPKYRVIQVPGPNGKKIWVPAAFEPGWGRPQNDGPALRATAMTKIVRILTDQIARKQKNHESVSPAERAALGDARIALKRDLDFVEGRWRDVSFDLWEEVLGDHFFTRVVQSEALAEGAKLLKELKDPDAERFRKAHVDVERSLGDFFDKDKGYIVASRNIKGGMRKDTDIDMAIIMAALRRKRGYLSASDPRVLATAMRLYDSFQNDPAFEMNRIAGLPGLAVGRYPIDPWTGERRLQNPDGSPVSAGHPWVITTLAMSQLFYQAALEFQQAGRIEINSLNRKFFELTMKGGDFPKEWATYLDQNPQGSIVLNRPEHPELFGEVIRHLMDDGNRFGARIIASGIKATAETSEQFSGNPHASVKNMGARRLGWNCIAFQQLGSTYLSLKATLPVRR